MDSLVGWNDELAALAVNKPEAGEQVTITPGVDQGVDISAIAALDAQFYQTGSNLWIIFEDGAIIVVEGYFEGGTEDVDGTPRSVIVDGETFTGEEFLTAFAIDDLPDEFAEGDVGAPETQQNGASFDDPSLGPLGNDPNGIGLLGNTLLSPTTTALDETDPAFEDTDPIIGAIETGFLDEDALLAAGSVSITGSLNVDFGANDEDVSDSSDVQDTPTGAGNRSITFDAADVGAAVPLESGGVPLNFVLSEGDTVLTAFANGTPVFEVRLFDDGAGSYQFTLFEPLDHPDSTSEDDLGLTFSFTATDSNGDTASSTFSVSINDDIPEVSNPDGSAPGVSNALLDEDDIAAVAGVQPAGNDGTDSAEVSGNLKVTFGADGFGSTQFSGAFAIPTVGSGTADEDGVDSGLTSDGRTVLFRVVEDGTKLEAFVAATGQSDEEIIFEATLDQDSDAGYTVRLFGNIDHAADKDAQSINFTVIATDFDEDSVDLTLSVRLTDDAPVVDSDANARIVLDDDDVESRDGNPGFGSDTSDGADSDNAPRNTEGTLDLSFGADGGSVSWDAENSQVNGRAPDVSFSEDNGDLVINQLQDGTLVEIARFTLNASTGQYVATQSNNLLHFDNDEDNENDQGFTLAYQVTDGDGDTANGFIQLTIDDDTPVADAVQRIKVDEDGLADGTDFRPGSQDRNIDLAISWGADGAVGQRSLIFADSNGDAITNGSPVNSLASLGITATHQGNPIETFTSDGVPVLFTISDNTKGGQTLLAFKEGTTDADGHIFSINLNTETTQYEFQLLGNLDHPADGNVPFSSLTPIVFTVDFIAEDGDGDSVLSSFEIELQDDQPEGTEPNNIRFDEDRLPDGGNDFEADQAAAKTVQTQSLKIVWGADNDIVDENAGDTFGRTLTFIAEGGQPLSAGDSYSQSQIDIRVAYSGGAPETSALSSGGAELVFKIEDLPNGGQLLTAYKNGGTPEADAVFKVTLDPTADNGAYTVEMIDSLDHGVPDAGSVRNNIQIDFGYQGFDADGDAIKGNLDGTLDFKITIDDDAPVIDTNAIENGVVEEEQSQVAGSGIEDTQGTNDDDFRDGFLGWRFNDETTHEADGGLGINWGADDANPSAGVGANDRGVTFASSLEGATSLTSRGDAISYEFSDDDTILTAIATDDDTGAIRTVFTVTLSDEDNGSYEFTLVDTLDHPSDAQGEDSLELTFDFVATDSDGDTADASFDVTVIDDQPITFGTILPRFVEEEGLRDGNQDGLDFGTSATGLLNIYWGGDDTDNADSNSSGTLVQDDPSVAGQRSVIFSDANNGPIDAADVASFLSVTDDNGNTVPLSSLTSNGEVLTFNLSNNGTILTAEADGQPVFTVTLSDDDNLIGSGSYTFDLLGTLDHPIAGNSAGDEDVLTFAFDFTASDGDGDIAIGNFEVRVVDDSPIATGESRVLVDEDDISNILSTGSDPFDGNRDGSLSIPAILGLGFAAAAQGDLLGVVAFGADGAAESGQYGFVSDAADEMSAVGLTSKGQDLSFVQLGNTLIGYIERRGSADEFNPLTGDRPVLSFTLNPDTGIYEFRLYDQLDHVEGNGENTALVSADGPINAIDFGAVILATDGDGDTVELTDKVLVTITDDVPVVDLYLDGSRALIDESPNRQGDDTNRASVRNLFNEIDDQDKGTDPNFGRPQYARDDVVDWDIVGTDEPSQSQLPANIVASLKITNENDPTSGFTTTIGDYPISLVKQGDLIVGRYNDGLTEKTAFAVHIDGQGRVSIVQYVALNHDDPNRTDESIGLNGKIDAVLTITDYDGDQVEEVLAIGHKIRFDDDAPSASRDTVDVVEDQPETFSVLDNDDLGADGVDFADVAVVRGPSKGTLEYNNQTGEFTYTPNANENGTDSFRYSITDGDGDTSEATVRINIAAVNDAPEVSGNLFSAVFVTETEDTSDLVKTRELKITDVDLSDQHVVTIDFNGVSGGPAPGLTDQEFIDLIEVGSATQNGADRSVPVTFKASSTAFDYLAAGEKVTFSYKLTADDQNGGVAERNFNVVVTGTNDGPEVSGNLFSAVFVTETEDTSDLVKTRELKITDVDLSDQHVVTIDFNGVSGGPAPGLTDQEFIDLIEVGSATQNGADRSVPVTFKASSTAFDYLAAGEKVTFSYKLTADDQNGGVAERNFNVVVTGTNDGPVITQAQTVGSVHEPGAFSTNINGTSISFNPALGESGEYRISGAGVGGSQTFDTLDGLVQALAGIASGSRVGGNSLQDAGPASGGFPNIISTTGGLLSLGGNSVAGKVQYQFSSEGAAQDFLNEVLTPLYDQIDQADSVASATEIATKGVIKFTDADLTDAHVFTATSNDPSNLGTMTVALNNGREATGGNTGEIAWRYSVDPDALNFLAEGETRQESFTVTIDDENGGVVSRVVTITQVGANDAPILSVTRKNNVDETTDSSDITTTINATFTDVDVLDDGHVGEVFLKSVNGNTGGNSKADFAALDLLKPGIVTTSDATTDGTIAFDFSAKSTVFDYLADGETIKLNYRITVEDEHGGRGSKEVDIIITGTNDAPVVVDGDPDSVGFVDLIEEDNGLEIGDSQYEFVGLQKLEVSDVDSSTFSEVTFEIESGVGSLAGRGNNINSYNNANGTDIQVTSNGSILTFSSQTGMLTLDDVNAILGSGTKALARFVMPDDVGASEKTIVKVWVTDAGDGNGNLEATSEPYTLTLNISGTNDTPFLQIGNTSNPLEADAGAGAGFNVPPLLTADAGGSFVLNSEFGPNLFFRNPDDDTGENLGTPNVVTVTVENGTLNMPGSPSGVTGAGTNSLEITGDADDITSLLRTLEYTPDTGFSGSDKLVIEMKDGGDQALPEASATVTFPIQVAPAAALFVGGESGDFATLQLAVNAALAGDTIVVRSGYTSLGDTIIDKELTILGEENFGLSATSGLRGVESTIQGQITITSNDPVVIDGLQVLNPSGSAAGFRGITLQNADGHSILNTVFFSEVAGGDSGKADWAIYSFVDASGELTITGNFFTGSQTGKYSDASWERGIWLNGGGHDADISSNTFQYTRTGMNIEDNSDAVAVTNNTFSEAGSGISIGSTDQQLDNISDNTFNDVDTDFNIRNVSTPIEFDLGGSSNSADDPLDYMVVLGGSADDTLGGSAGNDALFGNNGQDTAVIDGVLDASNFVPVADVDPGTDTVPGWQVDATAIGEGTDILVGVEIVQGADPDGAGGSTGRFLLVGNGGFSTIQEAVNASVDGDTILIAPGTYADPVSIDGKAITLLGSGGPGGVIIEPGAGQTGVTVSGVIAGDVIIDGITYQNSDSGVSASGNSFTIGNLIVQNSKFLNNAKHGIFVNGKNDGIGKVTVQDSTFENNGDGTTNGDGDVVLFEYRGDATLKNLVIDNSSGGGTADTAIQIAGFEQTDYDVNDPIGVVEIDGVQIDGAYAKVALYIQGYTDLTDLSLSDVSGSVEAGWGYATYIDPMSSAIVGAPPNVADRPGAFNDAAADGSVDLSGVTLANTVAVGVDPGHPLEPFNGTILQAIVNGTPGGETIIGTEGVDLINGRDGDDVIFGGLGSDIKSGGGGEDTFILNDLSSVDTILDYTSGEDKIDLTELLDGVTLSDANKADYVKVEGGVLKVDRDGQGGAETFEDAANLFSDGTTAVTTGNVTIIDNADTTAVEISIAATA